MPVTNPWIEVTRTCVAQNLACLRRTQSLIAASRRVLNPWWALSGGSETGSEDVAPTRHDGTHGAIHIVREKSLDDPHRSYDFVVSFGGEKEPVGTILLGKALGRRDLVFLLRKFGVSEDEALLAVKALLVQNQHIISGVTLYKGQLGQLGT